jgi:hypothetical protein
MKKAIIFVGISLIGISCTSSTETRVEDPLESKEPHAVTTNRRLITEVPINNDVICSVEENCAEQFNLVRNQLLTLDPIPVPDYNQSVSISWKEADSKYRAFYERHKGEVMANLFQQYYARVILNQYQVLESNNYDVIQYYLEQMIESKSMDIKTMTQAIKKLNGNVPPDKFNSALRATIQIATKQEKQEKESISDIERSLAKPASNKNAREVSQYAFIREREKIVLDNLKKSDVSENLDLLSSIENK